MSDPRSSTVYDYTSLRLHRNGRRVAQSDDNYTLSKYRRYAVKDSSGNWIAKDAGGLGTVRMRFGKRIAARDGDGECVSIGSEGVVQERAREGEQEDEWLLVEKERKLGYQARRRRDFEEDLDFLDASQHSSSMSAFGQKPCLPVPSSDLLKSIHYFTASLYTERGELLNLGKLYRAEKKLTSKSRMRQKKRRRVQKDDDDLRDGGDEEHDSDQAFSDPSSSSKPKTLHHPATHARKKHQQDMYRVMDGSALMALGMIMQEHVAMLIMEPTKKLRKTREMIRGNVIIVPQKTMRKSNLMKTNTVTVMRRRRFPLCCNNRLVHATAVQTNLCDLDSNCVRPPAYIALLSVFLPIPVP
ncbi:hypothetical protein APHAL10511_003143 [Amanita phalloides]|nr:hypothetical protein APHAL10511_003143 [Amanita phalloides]